MCICVCRIVMPPKENNNNNNNNEEKKGTVRNKTLSLSLSFSKRILSFPSKPYLVTDFFLSHVP